MTQKSLPPSSATPLTQPTPPPAPHSQGGEPAERRMTPPGLRAESCCPPRPPQHLTLEDQGRGWGAGDSPLLFRTLAEILPAES